MKRFNQFLKENPDKTSSARVQATSDIFKSGAKATRSQKKTATDVLNKTLKNALGGNRFFTDKPDSETLKTKPTGDESQFKSNKNVVNKDVKKSIPRKTKKVTVGALDKRDAAIKKLDKVTIQPQKGDAKKTKNLIKNLEKSITKPKPGEISASKELVKDLNPGTNTTITPSKSGEKIKTTANKVTVNVSNTRDPLTSIEKGTKKTIVKPTVTTNISKPVKFKSFLDRIGQATGVKNPIDKTLAKTDKVTGLSGKDLKNLKGKVRAGGILKGAGRFAGGVFAVKDAYDKAKKERIKGRSKTSQILGGIAKGAGGYIGGAIGATAGTLAGGGVGSFALGTGGAIAGYNLGSKAGEYLYKKGRQYATGEKKINFKKFMKNIRK